MEKDTNKLVEVCAKTAVHKEVLVRVFTLLEQTDDNSTLDLDPGLQRSDTKIEDDIYLRSLVSALSAPFSQGLSRTGQCDPHTYKSSFVLYTLHLSCGFRVDLLKRITTFSCTVDHNSCDSIDQHGETTRSLMHIQAHPPWHRESCSTRAPTPFLVYRSRQWQRRQPTSKSCYATKSHTVRLRTYRRIYNNTATPHAPSAVPTRHFLRNTRYAPVQPLPLPTYYLSTTSLYIAIG